MFSLAFFVFAASIDIERRSSIHLGGASAAESSREEAEEHRKHYSMTETSGGDTFTCPTGLGTTDCSNPETTGACRYYINPLRTGSVTTCGQWCANNGLSCAGMYDDTGNSCNHKAGNEGCDFTGDASDSDWICECTEAIPTCWITHEHKVGNIYGAQPMQEGLSAEQCKSAAASDVNWIYMWQGRCYTSTETEPWGGKAGWGTNQDSGWAIYEKDPSGDQCTTTTTTTTASPVDCAVSGWSSWSTCTKECNGGFQTRSRSITTQPANGGAACEPLDETLSCNTSPCPIDCALSEWGQWSTCTKTCGTGLQTRARTITTQPQHGGAVCESLNENQQCSTHICDADGDGVQDSADGCPTDAGKTDPGECGCGAAETDSDADGTPDCDDLCPGDPDKSAPGVCGCKAADGDTDGDTVHDCEDHCPQDAAKTEPGICGCGKPDVDSDYDGALDCLDQCPDDGTKTEPGDCGCGTADVDADGDGVLDCLCRNNDAKAVEMSAAMGVTITGCQDYHGLDLGAGPIEDPCNHAQFGPTVRQVCPLMCQLCSYCRDDDETAKSISAGMGVTIKTCQDYHGLNLTALGMGVIEDPCSHAQFGPTVRQVCRAMCNSCGEWIPAPDCSTVSPACETTETLTGTCPALGKCDGEAPTRTCDGPICPPPECKLKWSEDKCKLQAEKAMAKSKLKKRKKRSKKVKKKCECFVGETWFLPNMEVLGLA